MHPALNGSRRQQDGRVNLSLLAALGVAAAALVWIFIHDPRGILKVPDPYFRWQVLIGVADSECGGVIVKENWVLTAAHCVESSKRGRSTVYVYAGSKRPDPRDRITVREVLVHPGYIPSPNVDTPAQYDLALLRLTLKPDANKVAIALADSGDEEPVIDAFIAGWVCASHFRQEGVKCDKSMVYTDVPVANRAECNNRYGSAIYVCAGGRLLENLPGFDEHDSGSGLTTATHACSKLLGIASHFGPKGDAYARVSDAATWIKATIGGQTVDYDQEDKRDCTVT